MTHTNNKKLRVAVLFGGRSGEHEVSLVSASSVIQNLDPEKYEVLPIGITKHGKWISGAGAMRLLKSGTEVKKSTALLRPEPTSELVNTGGQAKESLTVDVVFPVLHGPYGEDGTVQGFLELTGIPYVGCGHLASAVCMDKVMQKKVLAAEGILQTPYVWFWSSEWGKDSGRITEEIEKKLQYPIFVKPSNLGSSVGISKAHDRGELLQAIREAIHYDRKVIVEQGVSDPREIECAVIGNQEPRCSALGEIIPSNEFYDYDAKYVDDKSESRIPADMPKETKKSITNTAIAAYKALDCEGMARVDFLLSSDGMPYLNELNTIPGFTSISMYPKLWEASGMKYPQLLEELIGLALQRNKERKKLSVSYTPKKNWYANN